MITWTKVSDRLPNETGTYLCWMRSTDSPGGAQFPVVLLYKPPFKKWSANGEQLFIEDWYHVTHWAEIDAPKEEINFKNTPLVYANGEPVQNIEPQFGETKNV